MPLASVDAPQLTWMVVADSPTAATLPGTEGGVVSAGGGGGGGAGGEGDPPSPPPPQADNSRVSDSSVALADLRCIRCTASVFWMDV
jgi:hypothetical protein